MMLSVKVLVWRHPLKEVVSHWSGNFKIGTHKAVTDLERFMVSTKTTFQVLLAHIK